MSGPGDRLSWALAAREAPGREALRWGDEVWNFSTLAGEIEKTCGELRRRGVGPGSLVAVQGSNGLEALRQMAAVLEVGATLLPVHPRLTAGEARALVEDARPALWWRGGEVEECEGAEGAPAGSAVVMYTSGTSGRPKGAVLSRRALIAAAEASEQNLGFLPGERWLLCLPLCHIGGLSIVTRCLLGRGSVVLAPGFKAGEVLGLIERHRPTLLSVVPTMLHALLEQDERGLLAGLRAVLVGGAAAPVSLLARSAERGVLALTTYGMTEACSQVTTQSLRDPRMTEAGSGRPLAGVSVKIDAEGAGPGEVGKIWVKGASMMDGYLRGEPLGEGWFDTGDLGSWDEGGRLHVHARRTDLIVTGGENVYPTEVEQALLGVEGVEAAMVFGVPDEVWGQLVAAALVARGPLEEERLRAGVQARLASHKRPRHFCLVEALPLGSTGKPLRREALALFGGRLRPLLAIAVARLELGRRVGGAGDRGAGGFGVLVEQGDQVLDGRERRGLVAEGGLEEGMGAGRFADRGVGRDEPVDGFFAEKRAALLRQAGRPGDGLLVEREGGPVVSGPAARVACAHRGVGVGAVGGRRVLEHLVESLGGQRPFARVREGVGGEHLAKGQVSQGDVGGRGEVLDQVEIRFTGGVEVVVALFLPALFVEVGARGVADGGARAQGFDAGGEAPGGGASGGSFPGVHHRGPAAGRGPGGRDLGGPGRGGRGGRGGGGRGDRSRGGPRGGGAGEGQQRERASPERGARGHFSSGTS